MTLPIIPPSHPVHSVFDTLSHAGFEGRIVGGCIRDMILDDSLDMMSLDVDIATTAPPLVVQDIFESAGYKVIPVGMAHGTVRVVIPHKTKDTVFEITTLRQDIKTDGRHAVVDFTTDWRMDSNRRDMTINALYMDAQGRIYDYHNGMDDLQNQRLRFIGNVEHRIMEDALRMIRYWRFCVKMGWRVTATDVLNIFTSHAFRIRKLSRERIRDEMLKMLSYPRDCLPSIDAMTQCGILGRIVPFPMGARLSLWGDDIATCTDINAKIVALCGADYYKVQTLADVWKLSKAHKKSLMDITSVYNDRSFVPPMIPKFLYYYDTQSVMSAGRLKGDMFVQAMKTHVPYIRPEFPVKGEDLMAMGIPSGAKMGALLKSLETWWVGQNFAPRKQDCLLMVSRLQS